MYSCSDRRVSLAIILLSSLSHFGSRMVRVISSLSIIARQAYHHFYTFAILFRYQSSMKQTRCLLIPHRYTIDYPMSTQEVARSIRFPKRLWDAIDEDAKRCRRSSLKQMEALLTVYYDLDNIEIDNAKLLPQEDHPKISGQSIAAEAEHPIPMPGPLRKRKMG